MATFQSLAADRRPLEKFRSRASSVTAVKDHTLTSRTNDIHVFEWTKTTVTGRASPGPVSVEQLEAHNEDGVRIICAPQDMPITGTSEGVAKLFEKFGIPSAFIEESLQGVSQSFAAQEDVDGTTFIWFHVLSKTLTVVDCVNKPAQSTVVANDPKRSLCCKTQGPSQADFSWLKPGFVLKICKQRRMSPDPAQTHLSGTSNMLKGKSSRKGVDLFCFGVPHLLHDQFQALTRVASCEELQRDPYWLLNIIFEEMFKVVDHTGWQVADIFGPIEKTLDMASRPGKATEELLDDHFTGIHNLAKHAIYLRENCDAALATLEDLRECHKASFDGNIPNLSQKRTGQALKYRKTLFQSTQRRLASLDARMANVIQLSFHIVTQGDSRLMQSESQSMKTIAIMTLIFMPLGTVASVFGSQFMDLQDNEPHRITVSRDFWLMWVIAIPLTILVLAVWWMWHMDARGRFIDGIEPRAKDGRSSLSWTTFRNTLKAEMSGKTSEKASV